jgi:hypothetical protein
MPNTMRPRIKLRRKMEAKNYICANAGDRPRNITRLQNITSKQKDRNDSHFIKACQAVVTFDATRLAGSAGCGSKDEVEFPAEIWPNSDNKRS